MDIYESRRLALLRILERRFGGRRGDLAAAIGVQPSYLSRMLKEGEAKDRKRIGEDLARQIEDKLRLADGELTDPGRTDSPAPVTALGPPSLEALGRALVAATPATRRAVAELLVGLADDPAQAPQINAQIEALLSIPPSDSTPPTPSTATEFGIDNPRHQQRSDTKRRHHR